MILTDLPPVVMDLVWRHRRELLLPWREALRQSAQATVRYETRPGKQLQADFGELWVLIGGVQTKVHFCVLTLGYSRRQVIRVYRQQQQRHWLQALAKLLGQELGDADAAVVMGFRGEGFSDLPVIGVERMRAKRSGRNASACLSDRL